MNPYSSSSSILRRLRVASPSSIRKYAAVYQLELVFRAISSPIRPSTCAEALKRSYMTLGDSWSLLPLRPFSSAIDCATLHNTSETARGLADLYLSAFLRQSSSAATPSNVSMCLSKQCNSSSLQCFCNQPQRRYAASEGAALASLIIRTNVFRKGSILLLL